MKISRSTVGIIPPVALPWTTQTTISGVGTAITQIVNLSLTWPTDSFWKLIAEAEIYLRRTGGSGNVQAWINIARLGDIAVTTAATPAATDRFTGFVIAAETERKRTILIEPTSICLPMWDNNPSSTKLIFEGNGSAADTAWTIKARARLIYFPI